jgi:peptide methionine sulfoxide reductase msrA/msrB
MKTARALFAAGCFWGVQFYFDQIPGITKTLAVYTGGRTANPTYDQVSTHLTGHAEAVLVEYSPDKVNYETLVRHFFRMHDPTQLNRQGPDIGESYRSAIFYFDENQKRIAGDVRDKVQEGLTKPVVTEIAKAGSVYEAESFHQKFTERTAIGMCHVPYSPI